MATEKIFALAPEEKPDGVLEMLDHIIASMQFMQGMNLSPKTNLQIYQKPLVYILTATLERCGEWRIADYVQATHEVRFEDLPEVIEALMRYREEITSD